MAAKPIDPKTFKGKIVRSFEAMEQDDDILEELTAEEEEALIVRHNEIKKQGLLGVEASKKLLDRFR